MLFSTRCILTMQMVKTVVLITAIAAISVACCPPMAHADDTPTRRVVFEGTGAEHKWALSDLGPQWPSDWSPYQYLVVEMRTSTPQRFFLSIYTKQGLRRIVLHPFGQNVWLRASIPLRFLRGRDTSGHDMASANNRRTDSFWMSVTGPFGELKDVEAIGLRMDYPVGNAAVEIRSIELSIEDRGSKFLEAGPLVDEFGQWVNADWPGKIKSREQLDRQRADEEKSLAPGQFNLGRYGGYLDTTAEATGFFRTQEIDGRWWLIDPEGHYFLSTGCTGMRAADVRRGGRSSTSPSIDLTKTTVSASQPELMIRRMDAWGLTTFGNWSSPVPGKAYTRQINIPQSGPAFLGMCNVYSDDFADQLDEAVARQCEPLMKDPWLLGYFIGNEPPWPGREAEVTKLILAGPPTPTQAKLKAVLADGDTPERRRDFVYAAFETYLGQVCAAIKRHDPNHLNLGIRFGGVPPRKILRMARVFDVCSINVYQYEPSDRIKTACEATGRPILIGEFHIGVPANGLAAGLVQAADQAERAKGYRYYMEQAAAQPGFVGAHWFTWRDEPVLGRMDGENYNIGFVDSANRPYPELVRAAIATHKRLLAIHAGKLEPFNERPQAAATDR